MEKSEARSRSPGCSVATNSGPGNLPVDPEALPVAPSYVSIAEAMLLRPR